MAAKHKAATEVTVAPHEERTALQEFVHTHWPKAAAAAVVVSGAILFSQHQATKAAAERREAWEQLSGEVELNAMMAAQLPESAELASIAEEHAGDLTGPWVRALEVTRRIDERDYTGAKSALDRLVADYPDHPLALEEFRFDEDGTPMKLSEFVGNRISAMELWERNRAGLFENPPLPSDAPKVKVVTSAGTFVVGLYQDRAPKHVENFLKLCEEGYYDGTKFHRVMKGFMVQGGDPNSRDEDTSTWGQGGPDYKIEAETENGLAHFEGYLAAAKMGSDTESSGSQFYVTTGSPHHLDGQHTVFGKLLEGSDVIKTIEDGEIAERDRPADPVQITSTEVM